MPDSDEYIQAVWQEDGNDYEEALLKLSSWHDTKTALKVSGFLTEKWSTNQDASTNGRYDTREKLIDYIKKVMQVSQEYLDHLENQGPTINKTDEDQ